jgi:hypothetical protein
MEKSDKKWARYTSDVIRHTGADMIRVVAWLCGGYDRMLHVSIPLHRSCYLEHHDKDGNRQ